MPQLLRVHDAQLSVLAQARALEFEDEMLAHLREFAPMSCAVAGEDNVRRTVRHGIERAARYGFTSYGPVRFYVELMFLFGSHFDTDPQVSWANEVLRQNGLEPELARADRLHQRVAEYLRLVFGPDHSHVVRCLRHTRAASERPVPFGEADLEAGLFAEFQRAHPEKAAFVGERPLRGLIRRGVETAHAHDVKSVRGVSVFCMIMFTAGHGFLDDSLLPWASRTLGDAERPCRGERLAERLEARGVIYLDRVLAELSKA